LSTLQEQYFFRENKYTDQFSDLGDDELDVSPEEYYTIALVITGAGETYTATATATGAQAADTDCAVFSVDNLGRKTAKTDADADSTEQCW
jgi:type IV pilus assembly protein PilE